LFQAKDLFLNLCQIQIEAFIRSKIIKKIIVKPVRGSIMLSEIDPLKLAGIGFRCKSQFSNKPQKIEA